MNLMQPGRFNEILENLKKVPSVIVLGDVGIDKYTYAVSYTHLTLPTKRIV